MSDPADALRQQFTGENTFYDLDNLVERMKKGDIQGPILFDGAGGDATGLDPITAVSPQPNHHIKESHDKIRLSVDLTRGTGTRDQEKHKLKARGETAEEAAEALDESLQELEERDFFERARKVENEPEEDDAE